VPVDRGRSSGGYAAAVGVGRGRSVGSTGASTNVGSTLTGVGSTLEAACEFRATGTEPVVAVAASVDGIAVGTSGLDEDVVHAVRARPATTMADEIVLLSIERIS